MNKLLNKYNIFLGAATLALLGIIFINQPIRLFSSAPSERVEVLNKTSTPIKPTLTTEAIDKTKISSSDIGLSTKIQKTQELVSKYVNELNTISSFRDADELSGTYAERLAMVFYKNIQEKNWKEALNSYTEITSYYPVDEIFSEMILKTAPLEVIIKFIDLGMPLTAQAIGPLSGRQLSIVTGLLPYGLDINAIYKNAYNGLSVNINTNRQTFDYLLEQGISTKPVHGGLDALDIALMSVEKYAEAVGSLPFNSSEIDTINGKFSNSVYFARQLVKHGALAGKSHLELITSIKEKSPSTYQALIENMPEWRH